MNTDIEKNDLLKSIYDEIEFIEIRKSIQSYDNKTNEEIESKLYRQKNNNYKNNANSFNFNNIFECDETNKGDKNRDNYTNNFIKNRAFNPKEKNEEKLEKSIKYIKYFSRKNYEDIRDKNNKKVTYFMIGIMIVIFILYLIGIKYNTSINRLLKALLMQEE